MKKFIKRFMGLGVIVGLLFETFPVWALVKDETIYAKLENNGQVNKVIVSEHLQGTGENKTFDRSKLDEIKNINGDEKFTKDGNKLVWESNGKDIYYQGQTKEELPISLKITYYFNGVESTIKEMIGKKGSVKIVFKYTNNDRHEEKINGRYTTLYTPFVVATTTILPNDTNYNIKVKNGKVIGNGTNSIVVLLSTPGLYESLGIDKLKGMDEAEISFDTDSFELSSIYSVSTPKLIDSGDLDMLNNIDGIYNSINTLVDSSNKLKSGSGQLLNGANQLKDGLVKLKDGLNSAYNGSKQITDGVSNSINSLNNDNSPAIDNDTLSYIQSQAVNGAKQTVSSTFTDEYKAGIANQTWNTVKENMDPNDAEVIQIVTNAVTNSATVAVTNAVQDAVKNYLTETNQLADYMTCEASEHQDTSCLNVDYKALEFIQSAATTAATTAATNAAKATASNVSAYVAENVSKQVSVSIAESTATQVAENTAGSVSTNVATQVATQAKETAKTQTVDSLQVLLNGLNELTKGLNELNNGMVTLDNGTSSLKDGIQALDNGIYQFNSQGINKISELVNGDVKTIEEKIKTLGKLSISYGTYDDSETGTEGATKIIMVVDAINAEKTNINTVDKKIENTQSLWEKIKENLNKSKNKK